MYEPVFNSVLVEINDKDAQWGHGNDESMLGKSYSKGKIIQFGNLLSTRDHPISNEIMSGLLDHTNHLKGQSIIWNEGVEAGTTFEFDGKTFGMIYWWDIRGVLANATN